MEPKLFGRYNYKVEVRDPGLVRYINLRPVILPHSHGRFEEKRFWKSKANIVERLIKHLMGAGHRGKKHLWSSKQTTGKFAKAYNIVKGAFQKIEAKTKSNPLQVLVQAIEYSAPREEITTLGLGGRKVPKQVDSSPQRRVDLSLRWMVQGAFQKTVNKKTTMAVTLANEIINAAQNDPKSFSISRKIESERQAAASR